MNLIRFLTVLGILICGASEVIAEDTIQLPAGSRIRVIARNWAFPFTAKILTLDDSNLTLRIKNDRDSLVLPRGDVISMAIRSGHGSRGKNALIGAGIGVGVGAIIGAASGSDPPDTWFRMSAGTKALVGGLVLAPIGALIGAALPPGERWREVELDRVHLTLGPVRDRNLGVAFALAF